MAEPLIGNVSTHAFLLFIFLIVFTFIIGAIASILTIRILKGKTSPVFYKTLSKVVMYGIYFTGFYIAFNNVISFNVTASLAALGVLGAAVVFPMLPILQNVAAGILLSFERSFQEEDIIEINGEPCRVKNVMLRKTRVQSLDGKIITIPNLMFVTTTPIVNYTKAEFIKVKVPIEIHASVLLKEAKPIIETILKQDPNILPNLPRKKLNRLTQMLNIPTNFFKKKTNIEKLTPKVLVTGVTKEKISLEVSFWTWDVTKKQETISSFLDKVRIKFREKKIAFG